MNLYTYCINNPLTFVDPSGQKQITSQETITVDGQDITLNKYYYTNLGLTVYESNNCLGGFFNTDPYKAALGYHEGIISYEKGAPTLYELSALKSIDSVAGYNQFLSWAGAGLSGAADVATVVKVVKVVRSSAAGAVLLLNTGKEVFVPSFNILGDPIRATNTYVSIGGAIASKGGAGEKIGKVFSSSIPLWGTYEAVNNAINYNFKYEINHTQLDYRGYIAW